MNNFFYSLNNVHFVGVGGVSMSKLCAYTMSLGINCSGSDAKESEIISRLRNMGVNIVTHENRELARNADLVVYSSAIKANHPELLAAKKIMERKEYLALVAKNFEQVIAISGAHGKTTTTAMIAWIFNVAGKSFTSHIGGELVGGSDFNFGMGNEYFITEACEYSKSFLKLYPDIGVVLNVDFDHPDCYKSLADTYLAFNMFMSQSKAVIYNANYDLVTCDSFKNNKPLLISYGKDDSDFKAENVKAKVNCITFEVAKKGELYDSYDLYTLNLVNVQCALAAISVCDLVGIEKEKIKLGLATFPGLKNRFQCLGMMSNGARMIVDYAHHPKQIKCAIESVYRNLPDDGDLIVLFEPHTFSRTKALFKDFCKVLDGEWITVIMPTYSAREKEEAGYNSTRLYMEMSKTNKKLVYVDSYEKAKEWFKKNVKQTDTILCLGAGLINEKLIY
ncbi:MAG: hypothetical protein K2P12_00580 [Clostridia bacterium]|nr:hypothetical protein [Clostridia bacterium]